MLVYWIVWILAIVLASRCKDYDYPMSENFTFSRSKHSGLTKAFFIIASIMLILMAGCRYYVGTDFGAYYRSYPNYLNLEEALKNLEEPGIRLIYWIAVRIHDKGQFCIFSVAAVTLGLELSVIYKNTNNIGVALVLFTFMCWTACFNGVRQALAASVLFCGFTFLRDKKFIKFAITVFLSFLCHRSAAVMILIYFAIHRKVDTKNVIILVVLTTIVLLSYDSVYSVMNVVMENDVTSDENYWSTQVNTLRVLTEVAPAVFFLWFYKGKEKTPEINFYLNLLIIHAVVGVSTSGSACFGRMVMYTMPFAVISMAELVKGLPRKTRDFYVYGIALMYWAMEFYEIANSSTLNPFELRWFW